MIDIHELLQSRQKANRRTISELLEVSAKTVQRDIDFMRDQLGLPIEYDVSSHSYSYTRDVVQFPTVQISERELVALSVAKRALTQYHATPFEKPLDDAFAKLSAGLREQAKYGWRESAGEAISFRASGQSAADVALLEGASQSILRGEQITFVYRKFGSPGEEARAVQPLHLACIEQQWYLFGIDLARDAEVRTFALARMSRLEGTGRHFERAEPFSIDAHLANSFGVFACAQPQHIVLRFDALGREVVGERGWHASQRTKPLADGSLELSLDVGISPEVERWILGWGEHVEVLAPEELRLTIGRRIEAAATPYKPSRRARTASVRA